MMPHVRCLPSGKWRDNRGAVMITTAIMLLALIGFAALAVDVGLYMQERQRMQDALDAGALAGAHFLPLNLPDATGNQAEDVARDYAQRNDPDLQPGAIVVRFSCFVRRDLTTLTPLLTDVLALCPQFQAEPELSTFQCDDSGRCYHACTFSQANDRCNAISLTAQRNIPLLLAPSIGAINQLSASLEGSACGGVCGPPQDLAVVMVFDRTQSMTTTAPGSASTNLERAKEGILSVLEGGVFNPEFHKVGLVVVPPDPLSGSVLSPLTDDYAALATAVKNLGATGNVTNLTESLVAVRSLLPTDASLDDTVKAAILLTDGVPNAPGAPTSALEPCESAEAEAQQVKASGIRLFTIGYSLVGEKCIDTAGGFQGIEVNTLLAAMATASKDDQANCPDENVDSDSFLCQPGGADLTNIFQTIIGELLSLGAGSRLVDLTAFSR